MKIIAAPECPLCGAASDRDNAFFPEHTNGLPIEPVHAIFHPPGLHWPCYLRWSGRTEFAQRLFTRLISEAGGLWGRAHTGERIAVLVSVIEPHDLQVLLAETGRRLLVSLGDWDRWRLAPESVAPCCHPVEQQALQRELAPLWARFPDVAALVASTDWSGSERHLYERPAQRVP